MSVSSSSSLPNDPVAALAPVSLWVARLGGLESPNARITLLQALRSLSRSNPAPDILTTLMQLDEQCQTLLDKAESRMQSGGRDVVAEAALSRDMQTIYQEFAAGYKRFIDEFSAQNVNGTSVPERIKEITARSIHCHCGVACWTYFLNEALPPAFWKQLHSLYLFAETKGFETKSLAWYDGYPTTVTNVYLRMLMLDAFNTGNLTPQQISIADKCLHDWCANLKLDLDFVHGTHLYHVNIDEPQGLQKISGLEPLQLDTMRYLDSSNLGNKIHRAQVALRDGNPESVLGISGDRFPVGEYVDLLEKLARVCPVPGAAGVQRMHDRARSKGLAVELVFGLGPVIDAVRNRSANPFSSMKADDMALDSAEETDIKMFGFVTDRTRLAKLETAAKTATSNNSPYKLHDQSTSGMGVITDKNTARTIALNSIVALRVATESQWKVGTVVRKVPHTDDAILIGIELLCATPVPVTLIPYEPDFPIDVSDRSIDSLYLPAQPGRADSLLIGAGQYSSAEQHQLVTKKGTFVIRMNRVIKQGQHWMAVGLEVVSKLAR
jgi:cyclic-di-GMP-binding protein